MHAYVTREVLQRIFGIPKYNILSPIYHHFFQNVRNAKKFLGRTLLRHIH